MKTAWASVVAAALPSACCLGPVVLAGLGAGALGAMTTRLEPLRPVFLVFTAALLALAFYAAYRPSPGKTCEGNRACRPASARRARVFVWVAAALVVVLVAFPYYVEFLP